LGFSATVHYLDDFLIISLSKDTSRRDLEKFEVFCKEVVIPLAPDKAFGPEIILPFLGITLDTVRF
jgi:hypothetical protein